MKSERERERKTEMRKNEEQNYKQRPTCDGRCATKAPNDEYDAGMFLRFFFIGITKKGFKFLFFFVYLCPVRLQCGMAFFLLISVSVRFPGSFSFYLYV